MGELINANKEEFQSIIESEKGVVLVDFWAKWCGPCKMIGPILEDISIEREDVTIVKIDVDEADNSVLSAQMGVRGIPAVFIFKGGEQVDKFAGVKQKEDIMSIIDKHV
jgi:thioredoxin 1